MNMEILNANFLNTTTMVSVSAGGTSSIANLFDKKRANKFGSGDASDSTITSVRVDFTTTQTVDRIALENITLKKFKIYHNSVTANLISMTSANTGTSSWTQNSETSLYIIFASATAMTSLTIEVSSTMVSNAEKQIGELWISSQQYQFANNPSAKEYSVNINRKEYSHTMSDGGTSLYVIADRYKSDIKRTWITEAERTSLNTIHQDWSSFVFVPFPTGTSWDSKVYAVNWVGAWDFDQYQDNYKGNGYKGTMRLREVAK